MDERLKEALDFSNLMITLDNQKRILKEQYQNNLMYYFNGSQLAFVKVYLHYIKQKLYLLMTMTFR